MVQCRIRTIRKILWGEGGQYPVPIPPQTMSWPIEKPVLRFDRGSLKIRQEKGDKHSFNKKYHQGLWYSIIYYFIEKKNQTGIIVGSTCRFEKDHQKNRRRIFFVSELYITLQYGSDTQFILPAYLSTQVYTISFIHMYIFFVYFY